MTQQRTLTIEKVEQELQKVLDDEGLPQIVIQMGGETYENAIKLWYGRHTKWFIRAKSELGVVTTKRISPEHVFAICGYIYYKSYEDEPVAIGDEEKVLRAALGLINKFDLLPFQIPASDVYAHVVDKIAIWNQYVDSKAIDMKTPPLVIDWIWTIPRLLYKSVLDLSSKDPHRQ